MEEKNTDSIGSLQKEYHSLKDRISERISEFKTKWLEGSEEDIFYELIFCLMTPQSKAELCWSATEKIKKKDIRGIVKVSDIQELMKGVRFKYKKSEYIFEAREKLLENGKFIIKRKLIAMDDVLEKREWLIKNIKGIGYKEAGHFLRNIGFGDKIAILDRHILRNLSLFGVIRDKFGSISGKKYIEIENSMIKFSKRVDIPLDHLDLLFWYRETGNIFK